MEAFDGEDTGEADAISAQSLYATLGLSSEDVDALAQIPESEISVETLPYLIMQLKAKRAEKTSAATDTDYRQKPGISQEKPDTPRRCSSEQQRSPLSSSSKRSGSRDHEHHGKGEGHRSTGGKRDSKYKRSSRERQSGNDVEAELSDNPTVFPHECSLCKCVVNSIKTWKEHLSGVRHKSRQSQSWRSSRSSLPPKRPCSSNPVTGDQPLSTTLDHLYPPRLNTRVVVAKFPMGAVAVEELLVLGKPFGTIVKHLVFPAKGFLEFSSHKEAQSMVSHYQLKPAFIKNSRVTLYLSPTVEGIHSPPKFDEPLPKRVKRSNAPSVVCFSRLPPGDVETEILEVAGMFGEVWQSRFTDSKALIEMADWRDADIMVKYYYSNPLRVQGRSVKVTMSHITSLREKSPDHPSRKSDSSTSSRQRDESVEAAEKDKEREEQEEEKVLKDEEGIQVKDEPGLLDESTDDIMTCTDEEEEKKTQEAEPAAAEGEEKRERASEDHVEEQDSLDDAEFPENIEDFVTLDELDSTAGRDSELDSSEPQDGKVLVVWPIRKTPDLFKELCNLSAAFGMIVKHNLSVYRQEAMIELETAEKAEEMVQFYREHKALMCGRPVSVSMSPIMKTIERPSGRSVFIWCLPNKRYLIQKYTYTSLFKLAKPFGKLTGYFLNRNQGTCYMQFETEKSAERMVLQYNRRPRKFWGSLLKIAMCRKGDSLICWRKPEPDIDEREFKKEIKNPKQPSTERTEKDPATKSRANENHQSTLSDYEGVCGDPVCEEASEDADQQDRSSLGPYQPDHSVGVNYVVPVTGFFCTLCKIFYSDEKRATSQHCCSLQHYNNLKLKHGESLEQTADTQTSEEVKE